MTLRNAFLKGPLV